MARSRYRRKTSRRRSRGRNSRRRIKISRRRRSRRGKKVRRSRRRSRRMRMSNTEIALTAAGAGLGGAALGYFAGAGTGEETWQSRRARRWGVKRRRPESFRSYRRRRRKESGFNPEPPKRSLSHHIRRGYWRHSGDYS